MQPVKHIVYCIAATYNSGGMERVLANKANYLVRKGYEVSIVTTDQQGKPSYFELDGRIRQYDLGVNYVENGEKGLVRKIGSYLAKQRTHRLRLTRLLKSMRADVVVSMFDHEVSFLYGIPDGSMKVLEIHFSRFKRLQYGRTGVWGMVDRWRSDQDRKMAQRYDRFVVLTEEDKGYWGAMPNITVLPNANSFVPSGQANLTAKRAIAVGRFDYQKGFEQLIAIWATVHRTHPDWQLDIFGRGPLKEAHQKQIDDLQLNGIVRLCPPEKNIEQEYLRSSFLVMTSRYEGLPMVLLEAQACGLPLVSYACKCGPRDVIKPGKNGFLIDEGDSVTFARKVGQLIEDDELRQRMGNAGQQMARRFSEDNVMAGWIDLFHSGKNHSNGRI